MLGAAIACAGPPADATSAAAAAGADEPPADGALADTAAFAGTTEPTTLERSGPVATLVAVRTAAHGRFERVVLEFAGDSLPGHAVAYEDAPRACGSGDAVRVEGGSRLVVRLEPARAHSDAGESTIASRRLAPGGAALRELVVSCDFEATLTWVVGLDRRRPYRVLTLATPARLVVDVGG